MRSGKSYVVKEKIRKFAQAYAQGKSGAASARLAGYEPKAARLVAHRLLKNKDVLKEVKRVHDTVAKKLGIDEEYVLFGFKQLAEDADPKIRVQALNSLAKHLHMMDQKIDMNVSTQDDFVKSLYEKMDRE